VGSNVSCAAYSPDWRIVRLTSANRKQFLACFADDRYGNCPQLKGLPMSKSLDNLDLVTISVMVWPDDAEAARHAERQLRHSPDFPDFAEELIDIAIMDSATRWHGDAARQLVRVIQRAIAENLHDADMAAREAKGMVRALPLFDDRLRDRFISQGILVLVRIERALLQRLTFASTAAEPSTDARPPCARRGS
jgi:hypothetical protein